MFSPVATPTCGSHSRSGSQNVTDGHSSSSALQLNSQEIVAFSRNTVGEMVCSSDMAMYRQQYSFAKAKFRDHIDVTFRLLSALAQTTATIELKRSPLIQFAVKQVSSWSKYYAVKLYTSDMAGYMLNDGSISLFELHRITLEQCPLYSHLFATELRKLMIIIAPLGVLLDTLFEQSWILDYVGMGQKALTMSLLEKEDAKEFEESRELPKCKDFAPRALLGSGSFGAVYKAVYTPADFICSCKLVRYAVYPRIDHAVADRIAASVINHVCVVKYYCIFNTAAGSFGIMEYVDGVDLQKLIDASDKFKFRHIQLMSAQMVAAFMHLHHRGILHRDIKCNNVLVKRNGRVKVIDFDTTKVCIGHFGNRTNRVFFSSLSASEFDDEEIAGTLPYMSPETLTSRAYGRASDWWSVGVVIYRLLTGKTPFRGNSEEEIKVKILTAAVNFPSSLSHQTEAIRICQELLNKNMFERLGSKGYQDLITHPFLLDINWNNLYNECTILPPGDYIRAYDNFPNLNSPKSAAADPLSPSPDNGSVKRVNLLKMEHFYASPITGFTPKNTFGVYPLESPIFQYVDAEFRRYMQSGEENLSATQISAVEQMFSPISINSISNAASFMLNDDHRLRCNPSQTQVMIDVAKYRNPLCPCFRVSLGIKFKNVVDEDGRSICVVTKVQKKTPASISDIHVGDIIYSINDKSLVNRGYCYIRNVLRASSNHNIISVSMSNLFRLATCKYDIDVFISSLIAKRVKSKQTQKLNFMRGEFECRSIRYLDQSNKPTVTRLVWICTLADAYLGDIILTVNGEPLPTDKSDEDLNRMLRKKDGSVTIIATSPLRINGVICDRLLRPAGDYADETSLQCTQDPLSASPERSKSRPKSGDGTASLQSV